jgi:hypothetical protein
MFLLEVCGVLMENTEYDECRVFYITRIHLALDTSLLFESVQFNW